MGHPPYKAPKDSLGWLGWIVVIILVAVVCYLFLV